MAGVRSVKKARKAQGSCRTCGKKIKKGQPYFWWKHRFGPKQVTCGEHFPRPSQTTTSDKLSRIYSTDEELSNFFAAWKPEKESNGEEVAAELRIAAEEITKVAGEYNESADNVEEYFPGGEKVDEIREKAEACETYAGELESAADEIDDIDPDDYKTLDDFRDAVLSRAEESVGDCEL